MKFVGLLIGILVIAFVAVAIQSKYEQGDWLGWWRRW